MLSVFITPWMKPTFIHCAISAAWRSATCSSRPRKRPRRAGQIGIVARDRVLGELAHPLDVAARGEELERADADVAGRDAGQHRAGQHRLAHHRLAGRDDRERARGRDAERVHRLADQHLAQHRPDRRLAVAAARERRAARALERDVAAPPLAVDHLAEQHRAAVAELRREAAELVPGIGLRDRLGAFGQRVAGEQRGAGVTGQRRDVEAELLRERLVEEQRLRRRRGLRAPRHREALEVAGVGVFERERRDGHGTDGTRKSGSLTGFGMEAGIRGEFRCQAPPATAHRHRHPYDVSGARPLRSEAGPPRSAKDRGAPRVTRRA